MAEAKRSQSSTRGKKKKVKAPKELDTGKKVETSEVPEVETKDEVELLEAGAAETHNGHAGREPRMEVPIEEKPEEKAPEPVKTRLADEYLVQCYFDKTLNQFVATVLEFGHIKTTGSSKADVIRDCENRLESHLNLLKRQGETLPETLQSRHYPEMLQVPISQGLYRRLDLLSRQEKTSLDQLVVELLSGMVERRLQGPSKHSHSQGQRPQQNSHSHGHSHSHREGRRDNHRDSNREARREGGGSRSEGHREGHRDGHRENQRDIPRDNQQSARQNDYPSDEDNFGNLKRAPQSQPNRQNRGRGGRNFHKTMESRENFLEYVRNLEKGNWKKR